MHMLDSYYANLMSFCLLELQVSTTKRVTLLVAWHSCPFKMRQLLIFFLGPQSVIDRAGPCAHRVWGKDDSGGEAERISRSWCWNGALLQGCLPPLFHGHLWGSGTNTWWHRQSKITLCFLIAHLWDSSVILQTHCHVFLLCFFFF